MRPFQLVLIGSSLALGIGGILVFAFFQGFNHPPNPYGDKVVIWGTLDDAPFIEEIGRVQSADNNFRVVSYVQKDERTFEQDLLNALAEGSGPDAIVMSQDMLLNQRAKILPIPYAQFALRSFKDTYIDGAEIFLLSDGVYALPVAVDPLVMYWNRDVFASKGLANPPRTWEELVNVTVPTVTERDFSYNVKRSTIAFGEYANVHNAKEILALLFMQAGSKMIVDQDGRLDVQVNQSDTPGLPPALAGLTFFTSFSNPAKNTYTWNRSLGEDRDAFLAGDLALYFGFASEVEAIRKGNPNLNFDIAEVPQGADAKLKKGYGTMYGFALMKNGGNTGGTAGALYALASQAQVEGYAHAIGFGTVHRASHGGVPQDPFIAVVERATLVARGWLDPNPSASDNVFSQMVEDATSGRLELSSAVNDAESRLRQLIGG